MIDLCVVGYLGTEDLQKVPKVTQNYHFTALKFLANAFQTPAGKKIMQNKENGM